MSDIKTRLRTLRGGKTQDEFSTIIGVHRNTLARWESGKGEPDFSALNMIAQKIRISPEWLLMGTGPMYKTDSTEGKTGDVSPVLRRKKEQLTDIIYSKKNKTGDASPLLEGPRELMELFKKNMELQERLMSMTQENADIRIAFERAQLENERHLSRIRDLERENAEIPALKARIAELERELSERPKLPKTVPVDVGAKSRPTPAHGVGQDTAMVPGAGVSGVENLGTVVRGDGE